MAWGKLPSLIFLEQRGFPEVGYSRVEAKSTRSRELGLRDFDRHYFIDTQRAAVWMSLAGRLRLRPDDGLPGMHVGGVTVADGPETALVAVGGQDVSLKKLQ